MLEVMLWNVESGAVVMGRVGQSNAMPVARADRLYRTLLLEGDNRSERPHRL